MNRRARACGQHAAARAQLLDMREQVGLLREESPRLRVRPARMTGTGAERHGG
jgi:hypothetical protein